MVTSIPSTPRALDAEQALLGSLIMESSSWEKISDRVSPSDFYDTKNKAIFTEIFELASNEQVVDLLVLEEALRSKGKLDSIGGREYLAELTKIVPTLAHITQYADIIREKSILRELITISNKTITSAVVKPFYATSARLRGRNCFSGLVDHCIHYIDLCL